MAFDRLLLRTKRQEKGISQAQLAEAIGVTPSSISNYERGTRLPPWSVARKLALYFNLPEAAFGYGEEEQPHAVPPTYNPATTEADIVNAVAVLVGSGWFRLSATGERSQDGQEHCRFALQSVQPLPRTADSAAATLLTINGLQNAVENGLMPGVPLNNLLSPFLSNALPKLAENPIDTDTGDTKASILHDNAGNPIGGIVTDNAGQIRGVAFWEGPDTDNATDDNAT